VITAMPALARACPEVLYVVLGATHPDLLLHEGDAYRDRLKAMTAALGVSDHVRFVDRFVSRDELGTWLMAADIFVTPYPNMDQIVSGTLSYAMGAGKAVVSTPYAYASEQLADGRGRLVATDSPRALELALLELVDDRGARAALGRRAHAYSRGMTWAAVGARYDAVFAGATRRRTAIATPAPMAGVGG
jgi:glycosyltransferase involved in cell wall biosynthesis